MLKHLRQRSADERGNASIQLLIVFPTAIIIVIAIVQGASYYFAQNLARSAANGAVQVSRLEGRTDQDGWVEASNRLSRAGSSLTDPAITVQRNTTTVTAVVSGHVPSLLPGHSGWTVTQTASGSIEQFQIGAP